MPRVPKPDYTGRDYDSMLIRIQRLVQSLYPAWTDFNKANIGNTMLRSMAFVSDVLSYNTDFWSAESLFPYARLRRSVIAHTQWLGYQLSGRSAAQVYVTLTTVDGLPHGTDIPLYAGMQVRAPGSIGALDFQILTNVTWSGSDASISVLVEHSENAQDIFTSSGEASQIFKLSQYPFIDGSLTSIQADDGTYTKVDNFLLSAATDKHFVVEQDDQERAIVRFGDGRTGKIPVGTLYNNYKVGGGAVGNVDANAITEVIDNINDAVGNSVQVVVSNSSAATGGQDRESIEAAKLDAPASIRNPVNTVVNEDYEIGAKTISGIVDCVFITSDMTVQVRENEGVGFVVVRGTQTDSGKYRAGTPTQAQLDQVEEYWRVTKPKMSSMIARAVGSDGGHLKSVNVICTLYLTDEADDSLISPTTNTVIGKAIFDALDDWFAVENADESLVGNVEFGARYKKSDGTILGELPWSDVFNVIRDTSGVRKIDYNDMTLNGSTSDVSLGMWEFPVLGTVTIIDADTGITLYDNTP